VSYQLYSDKGFVADIANARNFERLIARVPNKLGFSALQNLVLRGKTIHPKDAAEQAELMMQDQHNLNVRGVLTALIRGLEECDNVAIISDGVVIDTDEKSQESMEPFKPSDGDQLQDPRVETIPEHQGHKRGSQLPLIPRGYGDSKKEH